MRPYELHYLATKLTSSLSLIKQFFSRDREVWHMTLTFELGIERVKMNNHAKYLGQRSYSSKTFFRTHSDKDAHAPGDWYT